MATAILKKPLYYRFIKRTFDIAFSTGVIIVGFIPGLVLSAFIIRDTNGSPIYSTTRMGKGGKPFKILKFRTMVADADDVEKYLNAEQLAMWHRERKVENDPRITPLGGFLRRTSIDEFPQFLNSLVGQMSVIGPRAITAEELKWFGDNAEELLSMRPGIAWDIIAPKPGAGEKSFRERESLSAYEGPPRTRAVAA